MPEGASDDTDPNGAKPPGTREAETEADAKQNPKQQATAANGAEKQVQEKSPRKAGSFPLPAILLHLEQSGGMGDTEFESVTSAV